MANSPTPESNMNDDQIEKLAELIVNKMYEKQEELDAKFLKDLQASGEGAQIYVMQDDGSALSNDEHKLQMLTKELDHAIKNELFASAADLQEEINKLRKKLNK